MPDLTLMLSPRPALALRAEPPPLRAAVARVGLDELALLAHPVPWPAPAAGALAPGLHLDALRAVHACYTPWPLPAWLAGVAAALRPLASTAPWFAWCDGVVGAPGRTGLHAALVEAVGREAYLDLLRPHPPVQLLTSRLHLLPPALERQVAVLLRGQGVPDAVLLPAGESGGRGLAVGMVVAAGHHPGSRTLGALRQVAGHLVTARALRDALPPGALDGAGRSLGPAAARSLPFAPVDADGAGRLWRGLGEGRYALVDRWVEGGQLRVLARRTRGAGDPAALRPLEWAVLALVAAGLPARRAGERLGITPRTAWQCLALAAARLRCATLAEAAALAVPMRAAA